MKNFIFLKWFVRYLDPINVLIERIGLKFCLDFGTDLKPSRGNASLVFKVLLLFTLIHSNFIFSQINFTNGQAASLVIGQASFTANVASCSQNGLYAPSYTAISSKGVLAVSEQSGGRVKLWNSIPTANGANASVVVGKTGFTACSYTGVSASSISNSNGVAFSPDGTKLIVTDFGNNRVLIWNTIPTVNGQNADVVLGQPNFTSNNVGVSATAMNGPTGVFVSSDGRLLVADRGNHRILIWNSIPSSTNAPADVVVGQTVFSSPGGGSSATTMLNPWGVCVAPNGKLLVADSANNRVLVWNTIPTTNGAAADVVIGQSIMVSSGAGTSTTSFNAPIGVTVSPSGILAIGEFGNSRVVVYNSIPTVNGAAADVVLGQPNFTSLTNFYPSGSPTNNNMMSVYNASFDLNGRLFVVGRDMNRVLVFGTVPTTPVNLGVGITSTLSTACLGASTTVTVTLTNATATAASGVIATASLPAGFAYSSHAASGGTYNPASGYWTVGAVPASGTRTLTINGVANASGNLFAYASIVQSNQLDSDLTDNGASLAYTIVGVVPAPTGAANQTFCNVASVSNLVVSGTTIKWYATASGGLPLSGSLSLVSGTTYYASQTLGICEGTTRLPVTVTLQPLVTFYADTDGDGFGNALSSANFCVIQPGYVLNSTDCNDSQLQYQDLDGDGFGSTTLVACGVANAIDTNDALLTYVDADADGFGSTILAPSGVTNTLDCNDSQLNYTDLDGDGFGVFPLVPCGVVTNAIDTNDNLLTYVDGDGDGFGSTTFAPSGVTNTLDCNDAQLQYQDLDGDGFGSSILVACGLTNNLDCDDNQVRYLDADADGYGGVSSTMVACGGSLFSTDCDDANAAIHPGAVDVCRDGIDNDCNGVFDNVGLPGGCVPVTTTMQAAICGSTVSAFTTTLLANTVAGAQGYRFKITKIDKLTNFPIGAAVTIDRPVNNVALSNVAGIAYDSKYQFEVALKLGGVWQPFFGSPCFVNTPNPVSTISMCGGTLTTMNQFISTTVVPNVSAYRFRVTRLNALLQPVGTPQEIIQGLNKFNMTQLVGILYATTYRVEVSLRNTDGTFLDYNAPCTVTTPNYPVSELRASQCDDYEVTSYTEYIYANVVSGAVAYRFRVFGPSYNFTYDSGLNKFSLNNFPGLVAGENYSVEVAVKIGGQPDFGPYSKTCSIIVPGTARVVVGSTSKLEVSIAFEALAYPNPFAENFKLDVTTNSSEDLKVSVYDMLGKLVEDRKVSASDVQTLEVGNNYPSGVYNVIVTQGENIKTLRVIKR